MVLVSCFRKCFWTQRWGKCSQQHCKVQEFRVSRTPGGWLGRYKELMSLGIQAGEHSTGHGSSKVVQRIAGRGDNPQGAGGGWHCSFWCLMWCFGHWKAAGEVERPSSTLSSEAFPSLSTESEQNYPSILTPSQPSLFWVGFAVSCTSCSLRKLVLTQKEPLPDAGWLGLLQGNTNPSQPSLGLLHFPADSTKTWSCSGPCSHSCANILCDTLSRVMESADGLYTPEMWQVGWWQRVVTARRKKQEGKKQ